MSGFDWIGDIGYTEQEEFIINLIDSCDKGPLERGFSYKKCGKWYFLQDENKVIFYFDYDNVQKVLETKYGLNYMEIRNLMCCVLEGHYNLEGYTTLSHFFDERNGLGRHYDLEGVYN